MRRLTVRHWILISGVFLPGAGASQQALNTAAFDGWERWPLYRPGELSFAHERLAPLRVAFDAEFPGSQGFGVEPLERMTMYMDVLNVNFRGLPATWVQWTSTSPAEGTEAPALDALVVDRSTFRLLFRIARSGPAQGWAGRYEVLHAMNDRVIQVSVEDDGATETNVRDRSAPTFDFATYPFLFPLLDLREGMKFRLAGYDHLAKEEEILPVHVARRVRVADAAGTGHDAWQVDVLAPHGAVLITFYVATEPPWFYGWQYRLTRDGSVALRMTLRDWIPTSTPVSRSR